MEEIVINNTSATLADFRKRSGPDSFRQRWYWEEEAHQLQYLCGAVYCYRETQE
jgi:hypothetical protein